MVREKVPWRLTLGRCKVEEDHHYGKMKEDVRDLEIYWGLPDACDDSRPLVGTVAARVEELKLGKGKRRGRCVIRIERWSHKATWIRKDEVRALAAVAVFEEVVVEVCMGSDVPCPSRLSLTKVKLVGDLVGGLLETAWGGCREGGDGKMICYSFRPAGDGVGEERILERWKKEIQDANVVVM